MAVIADGRDHPVATTSEHHTGPGGTGVFHDVGEALGDPEVEAGLDRRGQPYRAVVGLAEPGQGQRARDGDLQGE